ncbi:glutamate receptor 1-like [Lucilia sericata]|uniref:glutamate receptor 1-like n=1 Tax=Lucilia sericata TaxID=13632 RepID=UPI0018A85BD7|nr:glutamate receptor 1-like [Lucilia sericata]
MVKEDANLTGNSRFEGFCIDLLKAIAAQVGFHYKIEMVPDNMYGVYNPETQTWNGIVRELMERRADLAVASMTINYARESVIDFTKPFMNLGIGILFKVPTSQPTRLFSFMNPLAMEIWLYVLAAYILVSFTLFVMARFSPYEWNSPHPCLKDSDIVENQFSVSNSFWFITGTFLRQGSGLNPKKSDRAQTRFFSFMNPLAVDIWIYIACGYVLVSLTIWIVARFSPLEWIPAKQQTTVALNVPNAYDQSIDDAESKLKLFYLHEDIELTQKHHVINENVEAGDIKVEEDGDKDGIELTSNKSAEIWWPDNRLHLPTSFLNMEHNNIIDSGKSTELLTISNDFTLKNCFWFAIGALMQQGSDLYPRKCAK